jgi:hypothetical protein
VVMARTGLVTIGLVKRGAPSQLPAADVNAWVGRLRAAGFTAEGSVRWRSAAIRVEAGEASGARHFLLMNAFGVCVLEDRRQDREAIPGVVLFEGDAFTVSDSHVLVHRGRRRWCVPRERTAAVRWRSGVGNDSAAMLQLKFRDWSDRDAWIDVSEGGVATASGLLAAVCPAHVRSIFESVASGESTGEIAKRTAPTFGADWHQASVRALIANPVYDSDRSALGVIDGATWQAAQKALQEEKARRGWREHVEQFIGFAAIGLTIALTVFLLRANH